MIELLSYAFGIGLTAGVSPGPVTTLVLTSTLERGVGAGLRVALAPLLTDLPILLVGLFAVGRLPQQAVRWIGIVGGLYLLWLAFQTARSSRRGELPQSTGGTGDLARGALTNLLNPSPWIFWITIGAPMLQADWGARPLPVALFLAVFWLPLVGSKALLAWAVARGRDRITGQWYSRILAGCAVVLTVLGTHLILSG